MKPWVKTSLAPGSKVVADYYEKAGLMTYLEKLNFHLVGFGCTTCIGNSGPLPEEVGDQVSKENLVVAAVLSGNRNFEGRINPLVKANYLASPPLVVAYASGRNRGYRSRRRSRWAKARMAQPVYLRDIWPTDREVQQHHARLHRSRHVPARICAGVRRRQELAIDARFRRAVFTSGTRHPPTSRSRPISTTWWTRQPRCRILRGMRVLAMLGDSVTTDHISPAGSIPKDSPAGRYLICAGREARPISIPMARAAAITR